MKLVRHLHIATLCEMRVLMRGYRLHRLCLWSGILKLVKVVPVKRGSVTFDTKLRQQKITSKVALFCGSETRTINKREPTHPHPKKNGGPTNEIFNADIGT